MDVALRELGGLTDEDVTAWRTLASRCVEVNPCFEPEFMLPAISSLEGGQSVRLLCVLDGGAMRLCWPVRHTKRWRRLPIPALVGWRHPYCVLGTPLVDRDFVDPSVELLVRYLLEEASPSRLGVLDWIGAGPVLDAIRRLAPSSPIVFSSFERPLLERRPDADYLQVAGKHLRKELARRRRKLEDALGPVRVVDRGQDPDARERFLALEAAGWKGAAGTALASTPRDARFFRDMTARFASDGRLELASLETEGGQVLAMALRLVAGEGVFQLKIAYDEQYRSFGPGRALDVELLRFFHEHADQQWVDSCADPQNTFKARLYPGRRSIETVLVPASGRGNRQLVGALPRLRRWRHSLRRAAGHGDRVHGGSDAAGRGRLMSLVAPQAAETRDDAPTPPSSRMHAECKPIRALDGTDVAAWRALAARAAEPNPFFEPQVAIPAARWLPGGADAELLCVYEGNELVLAVPVRRTRRWRRLRLPVVTSWCHLHCFVGAPLVAPGRGAQAWEVALETLERRRPRAHLLVLELLPVDGPAFAALQQVAAPRLRYYEQYDRAVLHRLSLDGNAAPMPRKRRRELERRARQIERETGSPYVTEDEASVPGALDGFLALEEAGWCGRLGTALDSQPATGAFAREAAAALHEDGRLVLLNTRVGSDVAASLCAMRQGATLFMFKITYDEALARFSPGQQLVHDMTRWFAAEGSLAEIDSCADPCNEFINRLLPDRKRFATVIVALDSFGGLVVKATPGLVKFFRRLRRRA